MQVSAVLPVNCAGRGIIELHVIADSATAKEYTHSPARYGLMGLL